jgi:2-haloacid dehalogenase
MQHDVRWKKESGMTSTAELRRKIKVCMFDQYGTVVDMQTGLTEVATPLLKRKGWEGNPYAFVTWWRRTHFENSMIDALLHSGDGVRHFTPGQRVMAILAYGGLAE